MKKAAKAPAEGHTFWNSIFHRQLAALGWLSGDRHGEHRNDIAHDDTHRETSRYT
jgi:hypothetical protein